MVTDYHTVHVQRALSRLPEVAATLRENGIPEFRYKAWRKIPIKFNGSHAEAWTCMLNPTRTHSAGIILDGTSAKIVESHDASSFTYGDVDMNRLSVVEVNAINGLIDALFKKDKAPSWEVPPLPGVPGSD